MKTYATLTTIDTSMTVYDDAVREIQRITTASTATLIRQRNSHLSELWHPYSFIAYQRLADLCLSPSWTAPQRNNLIQLVFSSFPSLKPDPRINFLTTDELYKRRYPGRLYYSDALYRSDILETTVTTILDNLIPAFASPYTIHAIYLLDKDNTAVFIRLLQTSTILPSDVGRIMHAILDMYPSYNFPIGNDILLAGLDNPDCPADVLDRICLSPYQYTPKLERVAMKHRNCPEITAVMVALRQP